MRSQEFHFTGISVSPPQNSKLNLRLTPHDGLFCCLDMARAVVELGIRRPCFSCQLHLLLPLWPWTNWFTSLENGHSYAYLPYPQANEVVQGANKWAKYSIGFEACTSETITVMEVQRNDVSCSEGLGKPSLLVGRCWGNHGTCFWLMCPSKSYFSIGYLFFLEIFFKILFKNILLKKY